MTTNKLLTAITDFFDDKKKKQHSKQKYLKQVLQKLKIKHKDLRKKLEDEKGKGKSKDIQKEMDVICAQRKKGLKLLKTLNKD